jgi:hypothetical protein
MAKPLMVNRLDESNGKIVPVKLNYVLSHVKKFYGMMAYEFLGKINKGEVVFVANGYCYFR